MKKRLKLDGAAAAGQPEESKDGFPGKDQMIKIDQAELHRYMEQMHQIQNQLSKNDLQNSGDTLIQCSFKKAVSTPNGQRSEALSETRKERKIALIDGESKEEMREKDLQKAKEYSETRGGLGGGSFVVSGVFE